MGKKLYVGNLSYDVTSSDLEQMFAAHGSVQSAEVIQDRDTGRSKGFGFVQMGTDEEAQAAIAAMSGQEHDGRALTVNEAKPREDRGGGGGGGRGGYGGGGGGGGGYGGGGGDRGGGGGGGYRGAGPGGGGDGGPMRDRRADFSGGPPPAGGGFDGGGGAEVTRPARRHQGPPDRPRRERDYEPRKRGFDDDQ